MRLALIADVHADVAALRDALAMAARLGCKQVLCAGDTVGFGSHPEETVALLCGRAIPCVRGNHDRWAANPAQSGALATHLSSDALLYLGGLPQTWNQAVEGVRLAMCHGLPTSDMEAVEPGKLTSADVRALLAATGADLLICGHAHAPFQVVDVAGGMIVNPGLLMREPGRRAPPKVRLHPRRLEFVEDPAAPSTFAVLDLPSKRITLHDAHDGSELPLPTVRTGVVGQWR